MHQALDDYLCSKYPKIFAQRHGDMKETCMCWGFSHCDGWFFLLDSLCYSIQSHIDSQNEWVEKYGKKVYEEMVVKGEDTSHMNMELIPQVVAVQVKEKFGGLRFYYDGGDKLIEGMVHLAENLSFRICEKCGAMNDLVGRNSTGWIRTTCRDCCRKEQHEEHDANRNQERTDAWAKAVIDREKERQESKLEAGE